MAISFGGEFFVARRPEEVFDFLTNPNRFAPLLPDFRGLATEDDKSFTVKVLVGISHIRGPAEVKLHLAEADRPRHALYRGQGSLAGGNVDLSAGFKLAATTEGTRVVWKGEAQVFGRLTSVAGGLLQPLARKNVEKLIEGLKTALA
ncbi:MAG: CoxG family protein [Terriglobia bacterium]